MKKLLPHILILVVLVGVFSPAVSFAQGWNPFTAWDPSRLLNDLLTNIAYAILVFLSWFAGFAGAILDYVLTFTIVNMKVNVFGDPANGVAGMTGINTAWKIIKDLMNIAFIFILLYESIKIIIGQGSVESVKRFVLGIVLASLLINFSLFFTKILIDASNIVTIGVYRSILSTPVTPPQPGQPPQVNSIATILLSKLQLQSVYNVTSPTFSTLGASVIFLVGSSIIFLISTFVLIAITANFVIRYITLIILLVLSPLAYMGIALEAVKPYQKKWWDSLKGQLIFAPVFMILLMIVITLISSPGFVSQSNFGDIFTQTNINPNGSSFNATTGGGGTSSPAGLVLNFTVVIGLLIATLTVSKSTAKSGAEQIGAATSKLTGYAGGVLMGGAGRLGRNTIGRAGNVISNSERLKDTEVNGNFVMRNLAKYGRAAGTKTATSSFDVRSTDSFGGLAKATGVGGDFGKGADAKKVNYQKELEDRAKKEADYAKSLKPTDAAKDRIKEQTGHTALEEQESSLKKNADYSAKAANEYAERRLEKEKELEDLRSRRNQITDDQQAKEMDRNIVLLQKDISDISVKEKEQASNSGRYKNQLKTVSEKVKESQKELDKMFSSRVEGYAKMFEEESNMVRYAKNAFRIPLGMPAISKSNNIEIARKIRSANKEKSDKEKLAELSAKVAKADLDQEPKDEEPKTETPKADKPTT